MPLNSQEKCSFSHCCKI